MKILWVKTDFLHPTTRGGQIRTLEMLKRLHRDHEVHYVAFDDPRFPEGRERAGEYSTRHYAVEHFVPEKTSPAFAVQLIKGLVSPLPVAVGRYRSAAMARKIDQLTASIAFDSIVCDFLFPAPNIPDLSRCVLFQHNVEAQIWRRHVEHASTPLHRAYFGLQYKRMQAYEGTVCRQVRRVIAVSDADAQAFRDRYGAADVSTVSTGVDIDYFQPAKQEQPQTADLVFLGSMDWMPNIDGMKWFASEVLPEIRRHRPAVTLAIVGRKPAGDIVALGERDPQIRVTGTVPDVRPWLHGSTVSIVPLRIGGGTRLKIYEAMAARVPVVSTTVGAEGLDVHDGHHIRIADSAAAFAAACLELLGDADRRRTMESAAFDLVSSKYSWDAVTAGFGRMIAV